MNLNLRSILLVAAVLWAPFARSAPPAAGVAEPSPQGTYGDWSLYSFDENGRTVCYLASRMLSSSETVTGRTAAYVLITHRPSEGKKGIISVIAGYPYERAASVALKIGRKQFTLFTDRDTAWADDSADPQIVLAIRGGKSLTVTGRAKGGLTTTDSYGLKGAAQALTALDQACPMPGKPKPAPRRTKKAK